MSLRAEIVRIGLRHLMKPGNCPETTVAMRRQRQQRHERWTPLPPRGIETRAGTLGGVPASYVVAPQSRADRQILFLHGGAYVTGSPTLYRHITWRFAAAACAELAAIDYRLAPEHHYPAALDDALAACRAFFATGAGPSGTVVIGDSAGGGLALALGLRLRDLGAPLPAAIVALSPWTDLALTGGALRRNADADPMMNVAELPSLAALYLGHADPRDPYVSPLFGDPTGLPPTLIQVGSDEVLYDDAARMAARMREAGCVVEFEVWPRMPHVWHAFAPVMPEARRAIARVGDFVRRATAIGSAQ